MVFFASCKVGIDETLETLTAGYGIYWYLFPVAKWVLKLVLYIT